MFRTALAAALAPAPACAASNGRTHHLVSLWQVACRDALRQRLSIPGPRGVGRFTAAIGMRAVDFAAHPCDPFLNVNTPEELAQARALAGGAEPGESR